MLLGAARLLAGLAGTGAPGTVLAQSGEQFQLFILQNSWGSLAGTGLLYAGLSFAVARGQRWRWAPPLAEIALVLVGTWGTFAPDPAGVVPFYCQLLVFTLQACVLGASLLGAQRRPLLWLFAIFGWWLFPLLLYIPGMIALAWALPWLKATGAALRH